MRPFILRTNAAAFALLLTAAAWAAVDSGHARLSPKPAIESTAFQASNQRIIGPTDMALTPIRAADVAQAVRSFIGAEAETREGWCRLHDPVDDAVLDLQLKAVADDRLMKFQPNTFVTSATLETASGAAYTVDYYVQGTTRQNLKVVDASIRSKSGVARYAWTDDQGWARVKAIPSEMPLRGELAH